MIYLKVLITIFNLMLKLNSGIFFQKRIHIFRTRYINFLNVKCRSYMYTFSKSDHFFITLFSTSLTFFSGSVLKECDGECPCPVIPTSEAAMFTGLITPTEQYPSATEAPFCSCPGNVYSPVCGVDGQVYDNPCLLACE